MSTRLLAIVTAIATLLGPISLAQAQSDNERQEMLRGGAQKKGIYNILGFDGTDFSRSTVRYETKYAPGTVVVDTAARRLYLVQGGGSALRYGIGVGRAGFQWKGTHKITAKKENPDWTPPPEMIARQRDVPRHMKGGDPANPLGTRDVSGQHALPNSWVARSGFAIFVTTQPICPFGVDRSSAYFQWNIIDWLSTLAACAR